VPMRRGSPPSRATPRSKPRGVADALVTRFNRLLNASGISKDRLMPASWDETRRLGVIATDKLGGRIKVGPHLALGFSHIVKVISHSGDLLPTTTFYYQIIQDDCSVLQEPIAARPKFGRLHIPTGQVSLARADSDVGRAPGPPALASDAGRSMTDKADLLGAADSARGSCPRQGSSWLATAKT
jgi:hypothetical protein